MLTRLTRFVLRRRRLVVGLWLLVTVVGFASAGRATNALSEEFSVPGREGSNTNSAITRLFATGGDSAPLVSVVTLPQGTSVASPVVRRGLEQVASRIEHAVPGSRVASFATTGNRAFVSRDGRTTFLVAYPSGSLGGFGQNPKAARAARSALAGVTIAGAPVHLTGLDALQVSTDRGGGLGLLAESVLGGLGALAVLLFVFASFLAVVPLVIALVSIMTSFLLVWGLTTITQVSQIVAFLIALVGLGVAVDYSLLVVARWREERAHGAADDEAIVRAMETAGRAVVFSGTTVAIGLLALVALPLPYLRSVGYGGMLIPLVSVAVAITLLPVILSAAGRRLDWPHVRTDERASRFWTRWAELVVRRRRLAAASALVVLAALLAGAASLNLGAAAGEPNTISRHGDARQGLDVLERSGIGSGAVDPIEILTPRTEAARVARAVASLEGVQGAVAPAAASWRHGESAVVDVFAHDDDGSTLTRVRDAAHAAGPHVRVGGINAQNRDFISAVYGNFPLMIALIAIVTFLLLARAFRSLLLPLKAVVLNTLSVAAAWGALTLVWQKGYGSDALWGVPATGSIPSWLPLIVFAFLFGLSMDYEVFILARMREAYDRTGSTDRAVIEGIGRTGRLVTSAALILFLSFVAMATAPSTGVKILATGFGAGILLDATIVRALLLPSIVSLFGRWNWWLPRLPARLLRTEPHPLLAEHD
ncbi:MAG TPA: MMPL family transporter [Gaiellaceae bacterium]|jgi:RND superfamily putative drug exporter|nr:MMPL family transporter [Gaiellaceae bacterium]